MIFYPSVSLTSRASTRTPSFHAYDCGYEAIARIAFVANVIAGYSVSNLTGTENRKIPS